MPEHWTKETLDLLKLGRADAEPWMTLYDDDMSREVYLLCIEEFALMKSADRFLAHTILKTALRAF